MDDLGLGRLELLIRPDNAASRAVAERAGGVFEGVLRGKVLDKGERIDMALYALVR
jgi:RimJ/RimL family protein N-acetyltransferase